MFGVPTAVWLQLQKEMFPVESAAGFELLMPLPQVLYSADCSTNGRSR